MAGGLTRWFLAAYDGIILAFILLRMLEASSKQTIV